MDREALAQLNSYETDFVFHEIFEENLYIRNGIRLERNSVVVDIGANIGLFSLFLKERCPTATIYAFEPIPDAYRCLVENCRQFQTGVRTENVAISDREGSAKFSYYPGYSVISGLHANRAKDSKVIETGMRNGGDRAVPRETIRQTVASRFKNVERFDVQTKTISGVIRQYQLETIQLMKIDAERSEVHILNGIDSKDWPKIEQMVLEVHSHEDRLFIERLLLSKGYRTTTSVDEFLSACEIGTIYAVREGK
jgi:FkbM family methyltransferase